jgi:hypothetical protein
MSTILQKQFTEIRLNFINLIKNFGYLLKEYNDHILDENEFYIQLNNLKKEINQAQILNPKVERNINYFSDSSNKGEFSYELMQVLINFPKINDDLLDSPKFYNEVHSIFEKILYALAFDTYNIGDFAELIAKVFNKITREKYFMVVCDHIQGNRDFKIYNCGRAFMQNSGNLLPQTKFIIFNTNFDAQPDRTIIEKFGEKIESDYTYSSVILTNENTSNENTSKENIDRFINELINFKSERGIDKKIVLDNFFNRLFKKVFYEKPIKEDIKLDFKLLIPILDLNYDIIIEVKLQTDDKGPVYYKFYTILNPKENLYGPVVLNQIKYIQDGKEEKSYRNIGIQTILHNLKELI